MAKELRAQEAPAPEGLRLDASNLRDDILRTVASARSFGGYYGRIMAVLDALAATPTPAEPPTLDGALAEIEAIDPADFESKMSLLAEVHAILEAHRPAGAKP